MMNESSKSGRSKCGNVLPTAWRMELGFDDCVV